MDLNRLVAEALAAQHADGGRTEGEWLTDGRLHAIAAVSGGADSMVLLDILANLRDAGLCRLTVCHVHHGLRGGEADRDAAFVEAYARRRGIDCQMVRINVYEHRRSGESVETAARRLRYDALERAADTLGRCVVMTAHHADDQAETVLDRLLRGTGPAGLGGMRQSRTFGRHVLARPLLSAYKRDLLAYAKERGIAHCEDSSNKELRYTRNRLREDLLPRLRKDFNPRIGEALVRLADVALEEDLYLETVARDHLRAVWIGKGTKTAQVRVAGIRNLPCALQRRVIKLVLKDIGAALYWRFSDIESIRSMIGEHGSGHRLLTNDWIAVSQCDILHIGPSTLVLRSCDSHWIPAELGWSSFFSLLPMRWQIAAEPVAPPERFTPSKWEAWFAREGEERFAFRPWLPGDRIQPLGMRGTKLVSDVFIDAKVPKSLRACYAVLTAGGEILWVPGLCRSGSHLVAQNGRAVQHIQIMADRHDHGRQ
ncbi:MAG: tRNA lysidine(34) synthetase TilS [Bacilli bacterium]